MSESLFEKWLATDRHPSMKWSTYLPVYEQFFARYRNRPVRLLEIGVKDGGSLQLWKRYLGPYAVIVGIDIDPECAKLEEDQVHVRIGSQIDFEFLHMVNTEFGPFDVVIDDGSHLQSDMRSTFNHFYPLIDRNGVYVVEDLMCSYWEEYGGGFGREGTFPEYMKSFIDAMQVPSVMRDITIAMHVYTWMVVFEKGATNTRTMHELGDMRGA